MTLQPGIKWISKSTYVDIDTGNIITRKEGTNKRKYIIIKTIKDVKINKNQTIGKIKYTRECRKQPQGKLDLS